MAQHDEIRPIDDAAELLKTNGFGGLADAVAVLLNSAMLAERSERLFGKFLKRYEKAAPQLAAWA